MPASHALPHLIVHATTKRAPRTLVFVFLAIASAGVFAAGNPQCTPVINEEITATHQRVARLRPHTNDIFRCEIDEADYRRLVSSWLRERPADAEPIASLYLGRVANLPWLSRLLADTAFPN